MTAESCRHRAKRCSSRFRDDLYPQYVNIVDRQQHTRHEPAGIRRVEKALVCLTLAIAKLLHESGNIERDDGELDHEKQLQQVQVHPTARVHRVDQVRQSKQRKETAITSTALVLQQIRDCSNCT